MYKKLFFSICIVLTLGLSGTSRAGSIVAWGLNLNGQCDVPDGNDFVAIADGNDFSLALKSGGSLTAWGINYNGECNVPSGNDFVAIGCGWGHSLALKSDGSLVAWGENRFGECNVPAGNDFVAIDGGMSHSLALKSDGSLAAWGWNYYGQCDVPDGNDFVAIASGWNHGLALKSDGSLVAWGENRFGECNVPAGNDFVAVDGGCGHSLALKSDGSLVGWGEPFGGLGDPPSGNDFVSISCGRWHCVALKSDGSLAAWGLNYNGECDVPGGNDFSAIAAGGCHNLAIKEVIVTNTVPVACVVGGDRVIEAGEDCEARVTLDGSCSTDVDSLPGTNDDINDFDWYEIIDVCDPNSDIWVGSGEVVECNIGLGEHLIILEVTDKAGAFDSNEVVITVEDVTPPEFSLVVEPNVLWPPNNKMVLVTPGWEVSDNCDEEVEVLLVDVTMSVAGDINDYVEIGDDGSIYLRARRSGKGTGTVYTITYQAVDDSNNVAVGSAAVMVSHDRGRH